jgi:hypothetical protein
MKRRNFLKGLGITIAMPVFGQEGPPVADEVESMTALKRPALILNHLGFLPGSPKIVLYRFAETPPPGEFRLADVGEYPKPFSFKRPLLPVSCDFGPCLAGDFTDLERPGMYQVTIGQHRSVPFFIRPDLWRRTLPKAFSFYNQQRCGVAVPNVHPACHLDDAKKRDSGQCIDVTGGWHDAGDLRKWMLTALHSGVGLAHLARNLGKEWNLDGSGLNPILEELRWGNRYWLKMQDSDGLIWDDAAGGVNGDNSDNHWTDNQAGNGDDRYLNPSKSGIIQAEFVTIQAMLSQLFLDPDPGYARSCLAAGLRCRKAASPGGSTDELSWWLLATLELYRATSEKAWLTEATALGTRLLALQEKRHVAGQKMIRGFWRISAADPSPYVEAIFPTLPPLALLELHSTVSAQNRTSQWLEAVQMYLEDYVLPSTRKNAFRIVPFGLFKGSPTKEKYRALEGELTYRYFMPVRKEFWWLGNSSHLAGHACLLAKTSTLLGRQEYFSLALRQLEWIMGANPFSACLMTGEGMNNPYPHSRFVGLISGGIMNGVGGNVEDEPVLDLAYGLDWRTAEYWAPHNAWYLWAVSEMEKKHTLKS